MARKAIKMVGNVYGKLTVVSFHHLHKSGTTRYWLCKCECGNFHIANGSNLRAGEIKSCGCLANSKNGECGGLHTIWRHVKSRCMNVNDDHFMWYGFRGIKICEEWKNDFAAFEKWAIEAGYEKGLTIDRINPDGDYSPDNCKWTTRKENSGKRRRRTKQEYQFDRQILDSIRNGDGVEWQSEECLQKPSSTQTHFLI